MASICESSSVDQSVGGIPIEIWNEICEHAIDSRCLYLTCSVLGGIAPADRAYWTARGCDRVRLQPAKLRGWVTAAAHADILEDTKVNAIADSLCVARVVTRLRESVVLDGQTQIDPYVFAALGNTSVALEIFPQVMYSAPVPYKYFKRVATDYVETCHAPHHRGFLHDIFRELLKDQLHVFSLSGGFMVCMIIALVNRAESLADYELLFEVVDLTTVCIYDQIALGLIEKNALEWLPRALEHVDIDELITEWDFCDNLETHQWLTREYNIKYTAMPDPGHSRNISVRVLEWFSREHVSLDSLSIRDLVYLFAVYTDVGSRASVLAHIVFDAYEFTTFVRTLSCGIVDNILRLSSRIRGISIGEIKTILAAERATLALGINDMDSTVKMHLYAEFIADRLKQDDVAF